MFVNKLSFIKLGIFLYLNLKKYLIFKFYFKSVFLY